MSKAKKAGIILLIFFVIIFSGHLYITFVYMRTPEYIHEHLTPPYEQEAEEFFRENAPALMKLVELKAEIEPGLLYRFTFHYPQYNSAGIPPELYATLLALEQHNPSSDYTISIYKEEITVQIKSGTNFDVYLFYGERDFHGMNPEGDKGTILEDGWEIHAPFVVRG